MKRPKKCAIKDDPIVAEVRRIRQAHAARLGSDLDLIVANLKAQEQANCRQYIRAAHTYVPRDLPDIRRRRWQTDISVLWAIRSARPVSKSEQRWPL